MIRADTLNLMTIFALPRQFQVPLFQRRYVWNKDKQWQPLWEDVQAEAERFFETNNPPPHFLGAVVVKQVPVPIRFMEARLVVDGQQRLITLQLLIAAARDLCSALGEAAAAERASLSQLVTNQPAVGPTDHYKVWPTQADRDDYARVMDAGSPEKLSQALDALPESEADSHFRDAYEFFYDAIKDWLAAAPDGQAERYRQALLDTIARGLVLVVIDLGAEDDDQLIFEALNARGTPLLASDLVKNYLLHQAEEGRLPVRALHDRYWLPFENEHGEFWRMEVSQGRLNRPRIEIFLQHFLTAHQRREISSTNLFGEFETYAKGSHLGPDQHLQDLHEWGERYRGFVLHPASERHHTFLTWLEALEVSTVYPFLLMAFNQLDAPRGNPALDQILGDIESYLVRRQVCSLTNKSYNKVFVDLLEVLRDATDNPAGAVRQALLDLDKPTNRWPNDGEFAQAWMTTRAYNRLKAVQIRMIMEAIEPLITDARSELLPLPPDLTIEHLMPRRWRKHWPLLNATPEAEERRETLLHTFGNLTLVTQALNAPMSNGPWSAKRPEILRYSKLSLSTEFLNVPTWDENAIEARGRQLLAYAQAIWVRPE